MNILKIDHKLYFKFSDTWIKKKPVYFHNYSEKIWTPKLFLKKRHCTKQDPCHVGRSWTVDITTTPRNEVVTCWHFTFSVPRVFIFTSANNQREYLKLTNFKRLYRSLDFSKRCIWFLFCSSVHCWAHTHFSTHPSHKISKSFKRHVEPYAC